MSFLIDTNILLRSADPNHPMYADAINATTTLRDREHQLCIIPQILIEFWNVYTRPADSNGLGHLVGELGWLATDFLNGFNGWFLVGSET